MKFEKVSYEQFEKDFIETFYPNIKNVPDKIKKYAMECYDNLKLPTRATKGSAGYDFFMPIDVELNTFEDVKIPTGIKCQIDDGYFLMLIPRSSMGFKNYLRLANTLGVVDSDFFNNKDNEGHISAKIRVEKNLFSPIEINRGERFIQGIFVPYGITDDDNVTKERTGGIGSTNKWVLKVNYHAPLGVWLERATNWLD